MEMTGNIFASRIEALRSLMRSRDWDAVVLTGSDPHCSEYPSERWQQVPWLSGFTGEAGDLVVTLDHAGLWTDTRYFIQAVRQLQGSGVELHKLRVPGQVTIPEWLSATFAQGATIAVDGLCVSEDYVNGVRKAFGEAEVDIVSVPDLIDALWKDRPSVPGTPVFTVDSGESREDRLDRVRRCFREKGCDGMLVCALDEIAWILNVRAADIEYNPLVISYLLIDEDGARWFVLKDGMEEDGSDSAFDEVAGAGVEVLPYADIEMALSEFEGSLLADAGTLNFQLGRALSEQASYVFATSPVQLMKAVKNEVEIDGMRRSHLYDGVAMERYLYWLEKSLATGRTVTEWDAAVKLGQYRSEIDGYVTDSFGTISAYGEGAALPHYITPRENAPVLREEGLYLCDSGGQYCCRTDVASDTAPLGHSRGFCGTTDITRTVPLGTCTPLEEEDYTLVLKGHIDLAMAVFPEGTAGCQIDALAREPLWKRQRSFGHGTGHGVGFFLGCHEGPQDVRQNFNRTALRPGMVISDEPGIYREGMFGVRHENLLLVREAGESEFGRFLCFEPLTLCHFDTSILRRDLLNKEEIEWLNDYNRTVYETLSPLLPENVAQWLKAKTAAI